MKISVCNARVNNILIYEETRRASKIVSLGTGDESTRPMPFTKRSHTRVATGNAV